MEFIKSMFLAAYLKSEKKPNNSQKTKKKLKWSVQILINSTKRAQHLRLQYTEPTHKNIFRESCIQYTLKFIKNNRKSKIKTFSLEKKIQTLREGVVILIHSECCRNTGRFSPYIYIFKPNLNHRPQPPNSQTIKHTIILKRPLYSMGSTIHPPFELPNIVPLRNCTTKITHDPPSLHISRLRIYTQTEKKYI